MNFRSAYLAVLLAAVHWLPAQEHAVSPVQSVQADLLVPLDAGRVKVGSAVLANVKYDWDGPGCRLRAGATVSGHVAEVKGRTGQSKEISVTVQFDAADCNGNRSTPFGLRLFALVAPPLVNASGNFDDRMGQSGGFAVHPMLSPEGSGTLGAFVSSSWAGAAMESVRPDPLRPGQEMSQRSGRIDGPTKALPGQVFGMKQITLRMGALEGGTMIVSTGKTLRLEPLTQLVLATSPNLAGGKGATGQVPDAANPAKNSADRNNAGRQTAALGFMVTVAVDPVPVSRPARTAVPAEALDLVDGPADETEVCATACNTAGGDQPAGVSAARASSMLSVVRLGFSTRDRRPFMEFNYDSALTYLDASSLLFTFDLHRLRERSAGGGRPETMRLVRAVLVDAATQKVRRIVDWQVQGEGQYLWRAGEGRVLVHIGHQLRLLGPSLETQRMIAVPGVLAWVATSPNGEHFAVGTWRERHTAVVHSQIADATRGEPEEDIDVQIFDGLLNRVATATQASTVHPPVLTDAGEIMVHSMGGGMWRLSEYRWDRTEHSIANTKSTCAPSVSTPIPDHLFIGGCSGQIRSRWYRLVRLDGHTVLSGHGSTQEFAQSAAGNTGDRFAVRVARSYLAVVGQALQKSDVKAQEVAVYEAADGRHVFSTTAADVPTTEQTFTLAPGGRQMAVLHDTAIAFYSLQ